MRSLGAQALEAKGLRTLCFSPARAVPGDIHAEETVTYPCSTQSAPQFSPHWLPRFSTHRSALSARSHVNVSTLDASMLSTTRLMATTNTSHQFQPLHRARREGGQEGGSSARECGRVRAGAWVHPRVGTPMQQEGVQGCDCMREGARG